MQGPVDWKRTIRPRGTTIGPSEWQLYLPHVGSDGLLVFDDDAFGVRAFGTFERAPIVMRLVRLDPRQQHLRAAFDARWSLD
jgi:hypothetical protein